MSAVPDLDFPWPECSVCGPKGDMDYDGHWWCDRCENRWGSDGMDGRPRWSA